MWPMWLAVVVGAMSLNCALVAIASCYLSRRGAVPNVGDMA